jgi:hypothetical protein
LALGQIRNKKYEKKKIGMSRVRTKVRSVWFQVDRVQRAIWLIHPIELLNVLLPPNPNPDLDVSCAARPLDGQTALSGTYLGDLVGVVRIAGSLAEGDELDLDGGHLGQQRRSRPAPLAMAAVDTRTHKY